MPLLYLFLFLFSSITALQAQHDSAFYQDKRRVSNPGEKINSAGAELNPHISADGKTLYFVREDHSDNKHFQEIWTAKKNEEGQWMQAVKLKKPFNTVLTNSVSTISPDGKRLMIKGKFKNGKYISRGFSITEYKNNDWTEPVGLEITDFDKIDKGIYNNACLSPDGKVIIFSLCEHPAGKENNLYISFKTGENTFSKPKLLPEPINITGHFDFAPFIAYNNKTLYFSSDRPNGLGENDIYKTERLDDTWMNWSEPTNLGSKINTPGRDSYFSIDANYEFAYMISDHNGIGSADIIVIQLYTNMFVKTIDKKTKKSVPSRINIECLNAPINPTELIYDTLGNANYEQTKTDTLKFKISYFAKNYDSLVQFITLKEWNNLPEKLNIAELTHAPFKTQIVLRKKEDNKGVKAKAKLKNLRTKEEFEIESNRDGVIAMNMKEGDAYSIEINEFDLEKFEDTFYVDSLRQTIIDSTEIVELEMDVKLKLKKFKKDEKLVFNDIYFAHDQSAPLETSFEELDKIARFLEENPHIKIEIGAHTDDNGKDDYNLKLSQKRSEAVRLFISKEGIDIKRMKAKGYGETQPEVPNDNDDNRAKNRRVEVKILEAEE